MDRKKAGGIHKKKQNRDKQGVGSPQTATAGQPPREPWRLGPDWRADSNDGHGHDLVLLLALLWFGTYHWRWPKLSSPQTIIHSFLAWLDFTAAVPCEPSCCCCVEACHGQTDIKIISCVFEARTLPHCPELALNSRIICFAYGAW